MYVLKLTEEGGHWVARYVDGTFHSRVDGTFTREFVVTYLNGLGYRVV